MKDTYINWIPSPRLIKKAKKFYDLHETGLTYRKIIRKTRTKHSPAYLSHLVNYYKNNILNK